MKQKLINSKKAQNEVSNSVVGNGKSIWGLTEIANRNVDQFTQLADDGFKNLKKEKRLPPFGGSSGCCNVIHIGANL